MITKNNRRDHKPVLDAHAAIGHTRAMSNEMIEPLRLPPSANDEKELIDLLVTCVHAGASVGFVMRNAREEVSEYWRKVLADYARGARMLVVARDDATRAIVGSGQLAFESRSNGRHRAEVQKLLVLPSHRRRGIASRLMNRLETEAASRSLRLLFLDTSVGPGGAVEFYQALGYKPAGGFPDYAADPDGTLKPNAFFYRLLG